MGFGTVNSQLSLVLLPSLNLVSQISGQYYENSRCDFESLYICSKSDITPNGPTIDLEELDFKVTQNPIEVKDFVDNSSGKKIIFCTYQSSHVLSTAFSNISDIGFDITIADEAHWTSSEEFSKHSFILDNELIRSRRRLFMTATPGEAMNDFSVYGKVAYELSPYTARKLNLITDYRIVISSIDNMLLSEKLSENSWIESENFKADEYAATIGLADAIKKSGSKKIITFHNFKDKATDFKLMADRIPEFDGYKILKIDGDTRMEERNDIFSQFEAAPKAILCNPRTIGEGTDLPEIDCISFMSPQSSSSNIVQYVGRCTRIDPNNPVKRATIHLPLVNDEGEFRYHSILTILDSLKDHGDCLIHQDNSTSGASSKDVYIDDERITFSGLTINKNEIVENLKTKFINDTYDLFTRNYNRYEDYLDKYKRKPDYNTDIGSYLQYFLSREKSLLRNNKLPEDRKIWLDRLLLKINDVDFKYWESFYNQLNAHINTNIKVGSAKLFSNSKAGMSLYNIYNNERIRRRKGILPAYRSDWLQGVESMILKAKNKYYTFRYDQIFDYIADTGTFPVITKGSGTEALARFYQNEKEKLDGLSHSELNKDSISQSRFKYLLKLDDLKVGIENKEWEIKYNNIHRFIDRHGSYPKVNKDCSQLVRKMSAFITSEGIAYNKGLMSAYRKNLYDKLKDRINILRENELVNKYESCLNFLKNEGNLPSTNDPDSNRRSAAYFIKSERKLYDKGMLSGQRLCLFEKYKNLSLEMELLLWKSKYDLIINFYRSNRRMPKNNSQDKDERRFANFLSKEKKIIGKFEGDNPRKISHLYFKNIVQGYDEQTHS